MTIITLLLPANLLYFISRCSITRGQKGLSGFNTGRSLPSLLFGSRTIATSYFVVNPFFSLFWNFFISFHLLLIRPYSVVFLRLFAKQCAAEVGFIRRRFSNVKHLFHFFFTFFKESSKNEVFCGFQNSLFLELNSKQGIILRESRKNSLKAICI